MNAVSAALNSRRFARTFSWVAGLVLIAGIVAFLIAYFGNTADTRPADVGKVNNAKPPPLTPSPKTVPLDPKIKEVANLFMKTAVARRNPALAYELSGPDIRQGETLAQWTRDWNDPNVGIAVQPYPIDKVQASPFRVDYSYKKEAMLEVALLPKPGARVKGQIFYIVVHNFGTVKRPKWLVNYWNPHNYISLPTQD
jgi:hypothetical protein